jgi:hypothetical protein
LQQQQQSGGAAAALKTMEQLRKLLTAKQKSGCLRDSQITVLNMWQAAAGGSDDVAVLLQQDTMNKLLQSFKQPGEGGSAEQQKRALNTCALCCRSWRYSRCSSC